MLDWLNYHHLLYFWTVAKTGSITKAAEQLHLSQPTLSNQLKSLEKAISAKLFDRVGRSLVLTETGQVVFRYADEIFNLGRELHDVLQGVPTRDALRLLVGVPDVLPKLVVHKLLKPALTLPQDVKLIVYEGKLNGLMSDLALHKLDVVLSDMHQTPQTHVRAFSHLLAESGCTVFAVPELANRLKRGFPKSLHGAPMLLPTQNTALRRTLESWFDEQAIRPKVMHEFEDSAVLKVFGQAGLGAFVTPSAIELDVCKQYSVKVVGHINEVTERYYAISVERRLKHPAVVAILAAAKSAKLL
jgi:LysR family transcriptional regulator, transcriptional activator of nhaA